MSLKHTQIHLYPHVHFHTHTNIYNTHTYHIKLENSFKGHTQTSALTCDECGRQTECTKAGIQWKEPSKESGAKYCLGHLSSCG